MGHSSRGSDAPPPLPRRGSLGLWGLCFSLGGLVTLGFLSPVGLAASVVALAKGVRRYAVAGAVLGIAGSLFLLLYGFDLATKLVRGIDKGRSALALAAAMQKIETRQRVVGRRLTDAEGAAVVAEVADDMDIPLRYRALDDATYGQGEYYELRAAGPDGEFQTHDDLEIVGSVSRPVTSR